MKYIQYCKTGGEIKKCPVQKLQPPPPPSDCMVPPYFFLCHEKTHSNKYQVIAHVVFGRILLCSLLLCFVLDIYNPFSAGTDFTRQYLTYVDVTFSILTSKVNPRTIFLEVF